VVGRLVLGTGGSGEAEYTGSLKIDKDLTVVDSLRVGNGSGKAAYNAIDDDATVGGTAALMNASNDLFVEGDFETGGAAIIGGNLTLTGELFNSDEPVALFIDGDISVNKTFLFWAALPYKEYVVNQIRVCASNQLSGDLTVSLFRNGTELTTTKATRPSVGNTEVGEWKTGLTYKFIDTDIVGINYQAKTVASDLSTSGYVELLGTVKKRR
jgi:hypothetical protein